MTDAPESEHAPLLRELGFEHYDQKDNKTLPSVTGELLFMSFEITVGAVVEVTFVIDDLGQHWINPRSALDMSAWGFTPLEEYARRNNPSSQ